MRSLYERYKKLKIDGALIGLEAVKDMTPYFCYPTNARAIGFEGCIMYCFIKPYGETVFASNPETCADSCVYPLARTFEDFLRLILTCGSTNPIEQIVWMTREQFAEQLRAEKAARTEEQEKLLHCLETEFGISPMDDPYEYVKQLQADFDPRGIKYSDEYYDVLGIKKAVKPSDAPDFCETVVVAVPSRKK